ncbi:hypothetical protein P9112_000865 [Eukaryota sp. TZLM1-RC]
MYLTVLSCSLDGVAHQRNSPLLKLVELVPFELPVFKPETLDNLLLITDEFDSIHEFSTLTRTRLLNLANDISCKIDKKDGFDSNNPPHWDLHRFPLSYSINELLSILNKISKEISDEIAERSKDHNQLCSKSHELSRLESGTLLTRSIDAYAVDAVNTEALSTVFVVVPAADSSFPTTYEFLSDGVCPRSGSLAISDASHHLYSVVVLRKKLDEFATSAKDRGWTVRTDYSIVKEKEMSISQQRQQIEEQLDSLRLSLCGWLRLAVTELDTVLFHLNVIKAKVEFLLMFGPRQEEHAYLMIPRKVDCRKQIIEFLMKVCRFSNLLSEYQDELPFVFLVLIE